MLLLGLCTDGIENQVDHVVCCSSHLVYVFDDEGAVVFYICQIGPGQNTYPYIRNADCPHVARRVVFGCNWFALVVSERIDQVDCWVDVRAELRDFTSQDIKRSRVPDRRFLEDESVSINLL